MAHPAPQHYIGTEIIAEENSSYITASSIKIAVPNTSAVDSVLHTALHSSTSTCTTVKSTTTTPNYNPIRGILLGPQGCGKTSLAMDLLYNIAGSGSASSSTSNEDCCVVLLMHSSKRRCTPFPAKCYPVQQINANPSNSKSKNKSKSNDWDAKFLNQVHIKHLSTNQELVSYLTSVQVLPPSERPYGGIVIDDLHLFLTRAAMMTPPQAAMMTMSPAAGINVGANENMRLVQILAMLSDAGSFLDDDCLRRARSSDTSSRGIMAMKTKASLLATMDNTIMSISNSIMNIASNYVDSFAIISPIDADTDTSIGGNYSYSSSQAKTNHQMQAGRWKIAVLKGQALHANQRGGAIALKDVVNYSIERDQRGGKLFWEATNSSIHSQLFFSH